MHDPAGLWGAPTLCALQATQRFTIAPIPQRRPIKCWSVRCPCSRLLHQVTQGTLDDLQAYRAKGKGGKGGKSKRSKAKKRNPNASDRSYSSGEDGGDHVDFMLNPIGYLLAFMSITAASLYGYKKLDGGGRGPPVRAPPQTWTPLHTAWP